MLKRLSLYFGIALLLIPVAGFAKNVEPVVADSVADVSENNNDVIKQPVIVKNKKKDRKKAAKVVEVKKASKKVEILETYNVYDFFTNFEKFLADIYQSEKFDFFSCNLDAQISEDERAGVTAGGGSPVYGEIKFESVLFLLNYLKLNQNDVFYDLGSGLGKFTYLVYLLTSVRKAIGIELSETRYNKASSVSSKISSSYDVIFNFENQMRKNVDKLPLQKIKGKYFELVNGNFLQEDFSDATVIFTCSTCFPDECMASLTEKFAQLQDGTRILTLRHLNEHKDVHPIRTIYLPMTWSQNTPVYIYQIDRVNVPAKEDDIAPFSTPEEIEQEVAQLQIPAVTTTASTDATENGAESSSVA